MDNPPPPPPIVYARCGHPLGGCRDEPAFCVIKQFHDLGFMSARPAPAPALLADTCDHCDKRDEPKNLFRWGDFVMCGPCKAVFATQAIYMKLKTMQHDMDKRWKRVERHMILQESSNFMIMQYLDSLRTIITQLINPEVAVPLQAAVVVKDRSEPTTPGSEIA